MILDNYLTYEKKIFISMIFGALWIYFRTDQCYKLLPRKNIFSTIITVIWIYFNYKDPLFLPLGLAILFIYAFL